MGSVEEPQRYQEGGSSASGLHHVKGSCPLETEVLRDLRRVSVDITDVFSPPRVTLEGKNGDSIPCHQVLMSVCVGVIWATS